ncbi:MAG: peptidoglycan-binding protein [Tychonema bourrellyi B0820]|uniref:Peptidoglycan-binding protein n=1 Tax=Tychonema bourrellyi FEM_GT703 TaxID=2040638 RepID=A0A2G4F2C9_9CYAN|nr:peptidoglycan-binding protein [Tychonema bourrellyi]MDQ2097194.1 peptidoglycan-binding protein [Tychonema bourrellyi B0820]PHX55933.1 peptidoglycan-binding protein [Tychonema bourrellyi FEM_GT703]
MSRNLTTIWTNAREVPSWLRIWSLCGLVAISSIASTPAVALQLASDTGNNSEIAQIGAGGLVRPALKFGNRGSEVRELQAALKLLGFYDDNVDGVFSQSTALAVSKFQETVGVTADGVVGQDTWNRLFPVATGAMESAIDNNTPTVENPQTNSQETQTSFPVLKRGMRGAAVRDLQERLRAKGFLRLRADGVFGRTTQAAVKAAQRQYKLPADGVVGSATWEVLLRQ